jgi:hypothetical protein
MGRVLERRETVVTQYRYYEDPRYPNDVTALAITMDARLRAERLHDDLVRYHRTLCSGCFRSALHEANIIVINTQETPPMPGRAYITDMNALRQTVNVSTILKRVLDIRQDSDDVLTIAAAMGFHEDRACEVCDGADRPVIEADGDYACLICLTIISREYEVVGTVTFTVRHRVTASSEDEAEEKFREQWDNGDVDTSDMDDAEVEIDRVEVAW